MGRHSNIILVNDKGIIIDAIKHVDSRISRVREVAPARHYVAPLSQNKISPAELDCEQFFTEQNIDVTEVEIEKHILDKVKGFSPLVCKEIYKGAKSSSAADLQQSLCKIIDLILSGTYSPCIIFDAEIKDKLLDFHCLPIDNVGVKVDFPAMSQAMDEFYFSRDKAERLAQKKAQLEKTLNNCLERSRKKLAIRQKTLKDVEDRDRVRLFGELIIANMHQLKPGQNSVELVNYYSETGETVKIPLKENISLAANAQKYFKKYAKAKSTFVHVTKQIEDNLEELKYLESVEHQLSMAINHNEIAETLQELIDEGYVKGKAKKAPKRKTAKKQVEPMAFKSSDGFLIFAGKNNKQNDMLTLKMSSAKDMWLHIKDFPGSHVIIRSDGKDISENAIKQAAIIAAFYSKASKSSTVSIDYTQVKNVKKISGGKPGMVNYKNFKTIVVTPEEHIVSSLQIKMLK
jgi:predicted ribosome quality control (RQC) complex YloA/Tae2 family protein